ncbi:murein L,D-transpeptidase catalytic domain-containing protein [Rhizobium leguminosarum]|uniref:murein L,D-transpeptidase catalytic domain-containing protein n=1 Tax=Rhizobium leguminosarum TaxID=384 RepID=UPI0021BC3167|nr:murein L,D-transpeptidase catalytic domain family protein [Rhizobium leguminosarum]
MPLFNQTFLDDVTDDLQVLIGQKQTAGMKAIVDGFEARLRGGDRRWLAYMLATAFHETAATMEPVREAFWLSENWRKTHLPYYPYYGRGYVQLTHKDNYKKAGDDIGVNLVGTPDLAMNPSHAAHIMFIGMTQGWFRSDAHGHHTLSRYFSDDVDDPVGARNIINGKESKIVGGQQTTVAAIIANYHAIFLHALEAGSPAASMAPAVRAAMQAPGVARGAGEALSTRFQSERSDLLSLADPLSLGEPVTHMLDLRDTKYPASHPRYWAIIDFSKRSDENRFHVFDMEGLTVDSYLCAHGKGSDPENTGFATSFSNDDGSNKSSLGVYRCVETYFGVHGYSMRLDGVEPSNDQARHRAIVIHPADYVTDTFAAENHRVGRSLGCPAVDVKFSQTIIDRLKLGSLLMAWIE